MRGFSRWICGHDKMNTKTDNTFNDPFSVGVLILKVRWKILRGAKSPEGFQDLAGFESIWRNLVIDCYCWHSDIETRQSLCVAK